MATFIPSSDDLPKRNCSDSSDDYSEHPVTYMCFVNPEKKGKSDGESIFLSIKERLGETGDSLFIFIHSYHVKLFSSDP